MKKRILVVCVSLLALTMLSCSLGKIVVKDDDFTKSKTITMYLKPAISDWSGIILMMWENEFYREVKNGKSKPTLVTLKLHGATLVEDIQKTAMLKVNDQVFNIAGVKSDIDKKRQTDVEVSTDATGKSTGKASTREWKEFSLKMNLTPQMEKALASATAVTIRLNAGNKPVTIIYSKKEVESLKNFITMDPNKPKK